MKRLAAGLVLTATWLTTCAIVAVIGQTMLIAAILDCLPTPENPE